MWSASQAGSKTLLGEVDTQYVSEEHFFRAGAAGRHDEAKMYAASKVRAARMRACVSVYVLCQVTKCAFMSCTH